MAIFMLHILFTQDFGSILQKSFTVNCPKETPNDEKFVGWFL